MMKAIDAAKALHSYALETYPDNGKMPIRDARHFYARNEEAAKCIRRRGLVKTLRDFPHLFVVNESNVNNFIAKRNTNFAAPMRTQRIHKIAKLFYDTCLRDDPYLRRLCEDRNKFDMQLSAWKQTEKLKGFHYNSSPPSHVIRSLQTKWNLLVVGKLNDEKVLVWNKNKDECNVGDKLQTREERIREARRRVCNARAEMEKNRNGVEVDQINFGLNDGQMVRVGSLLTQDVNISYDQPGKSTSISDDNIISIDVKSDMAKKKNVVVSCENFSIASGQNRKITVKYEAKNVGIMQTVVVFNINPSKGTSSFSQCSITRYIKVRSGDPDDIEILKPSAPYERKKIAREFSNPEPAPKGGTGGLGKFKMKLEGYRIPPYWRESMKAKETEDIFTELYFPSGFGNDDDVEIIDYTKNLSINNYSDIFSRLLWTEEAQMETDIKNYDMVGTTLVKEGQRLTLHVPGLAESRPSVLRGDIILVRLSDSSDTVRKSRSQRRKSFSSCYEGCVERVQAENAILSLSPKFVSSFISGTRVDVRFQFKRTTLRTAHQALKAIKHSNWAEKVLFPQSIQSSNIYSSLQQQSLTIGTSVKSPKHIKLINRSLNAEQQAAVYGVLASVARPSPYIIYGPPGTGKTITLVESILQTERLSKKYGRECKILVCAPSNAATDLLCERLAPHIPTREMKRIISYSRDRKTVSQEVMKYTTYSEQEDCFIFPPLEEMKCYTVLLITLSTSGKLPNIGINGHFTHVFIDEAGHSIEPDVLACLVNITIVNTPPVIVLAGDPQQLGPIVRSDVAKTFGLEVSLLQRVSQQKVYQKDDESQGQYDTRMITKLVQNYRSHPAILTLPNKCFYDGDLMSSADPMKSHVLKNWEHLPTKGFPLIFHGVQGEDQREGNSPSWFNPIEASIVKNYVDLLLKDTRQNRPTPQDIGIITPYHKQAQKLRMLLRAHSDSDIQPKVGSVDEFQGSERRVIIISTVRSQVEYIDFDIKYQLGFVSNPKRFNVAITRAQALLIVIGNPYVLEMDSHWKELIHYIHKNGGYKGCAYNPHGEKIDDSIDDTIQGIVAMKILDEDQDDNEDSIMMSNTTAIEGPEWRVED